MWTCLMFLYACASNSGQLGLDLQLARLLTCWSTVRTTLLALILLDDCLRRLGTLRLVYLAL